MTARDFNVQNWRRRLNDQRLTFTDDCAIGFVVGCIFCCLVVLVLLA